MKEDWEAVANAINTQMDELNMTQKELAARSGLGESTLRQLQRNYRPDRRPRPYTLEAISTALSRPPTWLAGILSGDDRAETETSLTTEVRAMRAELDELRERVIRLERKRNTDE
jgi:transcriptional regulator with XRE-family HTH domain